MTSNTTVAIPLSWSALQNRDGQAGRRAPIRIVHLGLGAFHRAHQAWFTDQCDPNAEWGIAAFTGRSPRVAELLAPQDGLFHLVERSATGDRITVVRSIVEAWDGGRLDRLIPLIAAKLTAIVTMTITEAGYRLTADGTPDQNDEVMARDVAWLDARLTAAKLEYSDDGPTTPLGRLLLGLEARRRNESGPIAIVPCDNMPRNGHLVESGLLALADRASVTTARWIRANVSFVSTSVDRITPATTPADLELVTAATGWIDGAPVVTEPFRDWVLSGTFPAGRPQWENGGALFVEDVEPFEQRKLWLLNGAHSLLAYAGIALGHLTVASAIADERCREWVTEFWQEARRQLPIAAAELDAYCVALLDRFENVRIEHRLSQIAIQGVAKLRIRVAPIAIAERQAGRSAEGCARAIGAWIALLIGGRDLVDLDSAKIARALALRPDEVVQSLLGLLSETLAMDVGFLELVRSAVSSCNRLPDQSV
ncbi:mannitol dehydrogenase family protein [Parafrigoribacterium mesophilum]|uniref:mannitol dehydrogenase family protein n=1 Tax=Parafrigoribacterium mesophilum TaxID=433646 RepID=UPI0031FC08DB